MVDWLDGASSYIRGWLKCQKMIDTVTPGYSVCIMHGDKIVLNVGLGYSNLHTKTPMTTEHLFRAASHSKTFTATAIMQLIHKGKIKLDDRLSDYLPFLKNNPDARLQEITVKQMLGHFAGVSRDGADCAYWRLMTKFPNKDELIKLYETEPLVLEREERFKYSNYGYALLSLLIEEVSGLSYQDYMDVYIFRPLNLSGIGAEYNEKLGPYVCGYSYITPKGNQAEISSAIDVSSFKSAIGFCATAEALCKFYSSLNSQSENILSNDLKKFLYELVGVVPDTNGLYKYGLGFASESIEGLELFGHAGGFPGQITRTMFSREHEIVVSVLTNSANGKPDALHKGIWHILKHFKDNYHSSLFACDFEGIYYDMAGPLCLTPVGELVWVSNPSLIEPFKSHSLVKKQGDVFKIIKESGFGSYGEPLEIEKDESGEMQIKYAGYPKYRIDAFEKYLAHVLPINKV